MTRNNNMTRFLAVFLYKFLQIILFGTFHYLFMTDEMNHFEAGMMFGRSGREAVVL